MPGSCLPSTMTDHFVKPGDDGEEHIRTSRSGTASHSTSAPRASLPRRSDEYAGIAAIAKERFELGPANYPDPYPLRRKCVHDLPLPGEHRQGLGFAPDAAWHGQPEGEHERVAQSRVGCHHEETIAAREVHRARARKRTGHARAAENLRPPLEADREDGLSRGRPTRAGRDPFGGHLEEVDISPDLRPIQRA